MGLVKPWHIIVLVVVLILLFGAKRLPDAARSLGRSLRIIKSETKGLMDDDKDLAEKADAQHSRQPLHPTEIQQPGQQPPYQGQQQPYQGQQPCQGKQPYQGQHQPYQQPYQQPQQPFVDPVQRTQDR